MGRRGINGNRGFLQAALLAAVLPIASCASLGDKPLTDAQIENYRMDEQRLIVETIPDQSRKQGIAKLLSERDLLIERQIVSLCTHAQSIRRLNANYNASRDQYSQAFARYNKERWVLQQEYVKVIAGMKKLTTADEWRPIAKYQEKYLNARRLTVERVVGGDQCS